MDVVAAVVAIISFQEVFDAVQQPTSKSERELLDAGLPVVFVVDQNGRAVAHPEASVAFSEKPMTDLKVVQDWQESGAQVHRRSRRFPPYAMDEHVEMLGSYATAELDKNSRLGVIAIQDEAAALASVSDMRWQTFWISLSRAADDPDRNFLRQQTDASRARVGKRRSSHCVRRLLATHRGHQPHRTRRPRRPVQPDDRSDRTLHQRLATSAEENRQLFIGTVKGLAAAIDGKDPYTRGHSERVSRFSMAIAQRLGLSDDEIEKIRISALLHDVGKIAIDDNILKKPAALTDDEYEIMKQHPQKGYKIMSQIPAMKEFLPGMYMHHEMVNGMGYPQGLKGTRYR